MRFQYNVLGFATLLGLTSVALPVQANSSQVLGFFAESSGDLRATGVAIAWRPSDNSPYYADVGLSYQKLQLRDTPAEYRRDQISPFFVTGRVGIKAPVSPYFQVGVDMAHFVKSLFEEYGDSCCNVSAQLGVTLLADLPVQIDLYGTWYSVKYSTGYSQERYQDDRWQSRDEYKRFSPLGLGVRLSLLF